MKFTLDNTQRGEYVFSDYGNGFLAINGDKHHQSLIIFPDKVYPEWPVHSVAQLNIGHFHLFSERNPDIIILGTGKSQQFPSVGLRRELMEHQMLLETMDTAAACRTYNLLVSEGRDVGACVIV